MLMGGVMPTPSPSAKPALALDALVPDQLSPPSSLMPTASAASGRHASRGPSFQPPTRKSESEKASPTSPSHKSESQPHFSGRPGSPRPTSYPFRAEGERPSEGSEKSERSESSSGKGMSQPASAPYSPPSRGSGKGLSQCTSVRFIATTGACHLTHCLV